MDWVRYFCFESNFEVGKTIITSTPLRIDSLFYLPYVENKGWKSGKTSRFKKRDISNLLKLLHDCLATVLEIDDSQFVYTTEGKAQGENFDGVLLCVSKTTLTR